MDLKDMSRIEQRSVDAFFSRIRSHLDDIKPLPQGGPKPVTGRLENLKEEKKYGLIERKQFDKFLSKYDPSSDKPTKTDDQFANTFAKLLYSRPGFHQMSSTDYLIEVLNIKDRDRDSFLGGHSTYETPQDETLKSLKAHHRNMYLRNRSKELLDLMDQAPSDNSIDNHVKSLFNVDPSNGNALAVWGANCLRKKKFYEAVDYFKRSLSNCDFIERVKFLLAEALHQSGFDLYNKHNYQKAQEYFIESLMNNPEHRGSQLHAEMCSRRVQEMHKRPGDRPNEWNKRRK